MKTKTLISAALAAVLLTGCAGGSTQSTASATTASAQAQSSYANSCLDCGFDTVFSLRVYDVSQDEFNTSYQEAADLFTYYNNLFDIYNNYDGLNNLKTINDNAGIAPVKVDPVVIELLQKAKEFYDLSGGEFDITQGALLSVWHKYREEGITANENGSYGKVPPESELQEAATHHGWDAVEIDEENSTVYITDPDVSLDVGGIAKGFATEKIAAKLAEDGTKTAAVNAGGNVRTLGIKSDGTPWRIGIQNPSGSGSLFVIDSNTEGSFVTSGDYERAYTADDGVTYSHIIDPKTLFPATYYHSVSIITRDSGTADCLSTTLFTMDYDEGVQLINDYKAAHPDETLEVVWIMDKDKAPDDAEYKKDVGSYTVVYTAGLDGAINWIE